MGKEDVLELKIETDFAEYAFTKGCLAMKLEIPGNRNWPDRFILIPDSDQRVFFIEFKRKDEEPRRAQKYRINQLRKMGYDAQVFDTLGAAKLFLHEKIKEFRSKAKK